MHVEYEHRSFVGVDQACQYDAGQEGLSGTCRTEHARGALDELLQVDADGVILLAGVADDEVAALALFAEDLGDVTFVRQVDLGMVRRHVLDGQDARRVFETGVDHALPVLVIGRAGLGSDLEHQVGQHLQVGVERLTIKSFGDLRRIPDPGLLISKALVGGAEDDIHDDAVVVPVPALDDDERAFLDLLRRDRKPHAEVFLQPTTDEIADLCSLYFHQ